MDGVIEQLLHRREAGANGGGVLGTIGHLLHLVMLDTRASALQVAQAMRQVHPQGFRLDDKAQYALDFRIIDGDVGLPHNSFHTEPLPQSCLCVYASQPGLEYIRESLEKTLLANLEQEDRLPPRPAPGHGVCGPGGLPARGGHQPGQEPAVPLRGRQRRPGPRATGAGAVHAGGEHRAAGGPASHLPGGPAADAVHGVRGPVRARAGAGAAGLPGHGPAALH
ncbi:hypothetical protein HPB48_002312 [Haemaphysalis longicornis]|uniref:Rho GTPase-activating protein pG1 and pG2 domain-containing protein n=1 Tax=Haemaphysalis longicornis TaxID=44386 RepID=A0A9J6GKL9_HAELO|nr:hypothetical protein HPB48_002312 [Haemaphysalis longicornis]